MRAPGQAVLHSAPGNAIRGAVSPRLLDEIEAALSASDMHEKAADLMALRGRITEAVEAYRG
jgi:hypothetical protein